MSDVEQLCAKLDALGVDRDTTSKARQDLGEHADREVNWLHLAVHLRRTRQFEAALETYEVALRHFPRSARMWNNRGVLLRDYGHLDKAIASFEKALQLEPDYVHAIESMAIAYEKLQDYPTASRFYRRALSLDERRSTCWNNLGNCLRMQGARREACDCYNTVLKSEPTHTDAMFNLATLQYELMDYAAALKTIEQCALLAPSDAAVEALRKEIEAQPAQPRPVGPPPLHGTDYLFRLSTNIDECGNVIEPDFSSPLVLSGDEILAMSREDAARVVGTAMWDRLHLRRLVQESLPESQPPPHEFPLPFISYRWGDLAHTEWVCRFVRDLEDRGYDVLFDKNAEREKRPPSPPELIARMTECSLFVPIITNRYTERVLVSPDRSSPVDDGWVFDEWEIATMLGNMQRLRFVGIWASGDSLPPPFTRANVCDFRDLAQYSQQMDKIFPVRYVMVVGIRPDKTFRALTKIKRSKSNEAAAKLQSLREFEHIAILEDPANRGKEPGGDWPTRGRHA